MMTATAAPLTFAQPVEETNIFDRAICLSLELRRLGTKRKVQTSSLRAQVDTDEDMIHVSKDLLESPELDAIRKHDGETRRLLAAKVSGPALFRSGVYMLAIDMVPEVDQELTARLITRAETLVPAFVAAYEKSVDDARERLKNLFNTLDYPTVGQVETTFSASTRYFTLGSPQGLERISADILAREERKASLQWSAVLDESRAVLRAEMAELVTHMVERLEPAADGKKKRFNASTVENLDGFLESFGKRSIANDAELQTIVTQARDALAGTTVQDLRESSFERSMVKARFTELKTTLDALVTTGGRCYNFEE